MSVTDRHVSVAKRADFLTAFTKKVQALERLAGDGNRELLPGCTATAFIRWSLPELDVYPISRDGFYKRMPDHAALRKRVKRTLEALKARTLRPSRSENAITKLQSELVEVREQRDAAETLAVSAKSDLRVVRARIAALESQLGRASKAGQNIIQFTPIPRRKKP